jgi:hypothetical protein
MLRFGVKEMKGRGGQRIRQQVIPQASKKQGWAGGSTAGQSHSAKLPAAWTKRVCHYESQLIHEMQHFFYIYKNLIEKKARTVLTTDNRKGQQRTEYVAAPLDQSRVRDPCGMDARHGSRSTPNDSGIPSKHSERANVCFRSLFPRLDFAYGLKTNTSLVAAEHRRARPRLQIPYPAHASRRLN